MIKTLSSRNLIGVLAILLLFSLSASATTAQDSGNYLCVSAPAQIAKGDTEAINIEIDLAVTQPEGYTCKPVDTVEEVMGVGISGTRTNFLLEPIDSHEDAGMQNPGANQWTWTINAIGEEETSHNLIVYASVPDETRRTGYRSVTTLPIRVTIKPPTGTVFDQIIRFLDGTKEILLVLTAIIVAVIGLRGQIKSLLSGGTKKPTP